MKEITKRNSYIKVFLVDCIRKATCTEKHDNH